MTTAELTDEQYDIADAIEVAIAKLPADTFLPPSQIARKARIEHTNQVRYVLDWMVSRQMWRAAGNGAWTRYAMGR